MLYYQSAATKQDTGSFLLHLHDRKFYSNGSPTNEVMSLQSHTIRCVYKTLFTNPVSYCVVHNTDITIVPVQ